MFSENTLITVIIFCIIAFSSEKHYIGRFSLLPYVLLVYFEINENWSILPDLLKLWIIIGFVIGLIALVSIISNDPMSSTIYDLSYAIYSGKTVMGIYIPLILFKEYFPTFLFEPLFFAAMIIGIVSFWYVGVNIFSNDPPFN
ncbi:hypothetical protein LI82_07680 [Methanococcoides methylutens]|uniref:Uncharacterized protein n=1 Tax=Methanococcoides methylutens TaxID=2226 RepID=A0A099T3C7_METMT|nr:hypothetical protein [Methanococcoides methylutens]KGK98716.1 hypothetical protein LI82_07680 [Methanococcoides methylutens]